MKNYRKKHVVLGLFFRKTKKHPIDPVNGDPSDGIKQSLTVGEIDAETNFLHELVIISVHALNSEGFIELYDDPQHDPYGIESRYRITIEGKKAFQEKFYLNKIWYRTWSFWLAFLPIIVSIAALVTSIIALKQQP